MTDEQFSNDLKQIVEQARVQIVALMERARDEDVGCGGFMGDAPVSWAHAEGYGWDRTADQLAELGGWVHDRLRGTNRTHKRQSVTVKIRKALGYTCP